MESVNITAQKARRNYGIDALRLLAMLMVVILHVLGQGGVLSTAQEGKAALSWFLEISAYCAVDCYALISGYVAFSQTEKPYHYTKYVKMWLQVFCYSFGITLVGFILRPEYIGIKTLIRSLAPVATSHYWYFSAYTGLFFMIPWLNTFVRERSERELTRFILMIVSVFSFYAAPARLFSDTFTLSAGYSFIWLCFLYLIGAWMKKCRIPDKVKIRHALFGGGILYPDNVVRKDVFAVCEYAPGLLY